MKRFNWRIVATVCAIGSIPVIGFATTAFQGPSATPPAGNVPGVIWNMAGTGQTQTGAEINISGTAKVSNIEATTIDNTILRDIYLEGTKAFRIDYNGAATYNMGNWGGAGGTSKPLGFTIYGDVKSDWVDPYVGTGNEGRMQARKFCFHPGNPTDCITNWSGASGNYVLKTGDTMLGTLKIYDTNNGLFSSASATAIFGYADGSSGTGGDFYGKGYGLKAVGGSFVGGDFEGPWGVYARSSVSTGIAVYGWGGDVGGQFYSEVSGVSSTAYGANSVGVKGLSTGNNGFGIKGLASRTNGVGGSFEGYTGVSSLGASVGVFGDSNQNNGIGVSGRALNAGGRGGYFYGAENAISAESPNIAISATGSSIGMEARITGLGAWDRAFYGWGGSFGGLFMGTQSGVRGANTGNNSIGNLGSALGYGVDGTGSVAGVHGEYAPNTSNYGSLGMVNYGVYGHGVIAGVYGIDADSSSYGQIGYGSYGGNFYGTSYGVNGEGSAYGLRGQDTETDKYGYIGFGDYSFYGNGNIYISGIAYKAGTLAWQALSDSRLKNVLGNFEYGLDEIGELEIKKFKYKEGNALNLPVDEEYVGLIAQDVEKVIPEAVSEVNGYKTLKADPIIWAMLNSIKELKAKNEELKARIETLEKR